MITDCKQRIPDSVGTVCLYVSLVRSYLEADTRFGGGEDRGEGSRSTGGHVLSDIAS